MRIPPYHWWRTVFYLIPAITVYTIVLGAASLLTTPKQIHQNNRFGFAPVIEVAILFAGIFVTAVGLFIFDRSPKQRSAELKLVERERRAA